MLAWASSSHKVMNMPEMRHREEAVNTQLAVLLSRFGVKADAETILSQGAERPDVLFGFSGLRVAIEGKFDDLPSAKEAALENAKGRVERGISHIAAAVVYPGNLRLSPTTQLLSRLETAVLTYRIVSETGETEWVEGSPASLMDALRRVQETLAQDDIVEKTARSLSALLEIVAGLWLPQPVTCDRLAAILGMVAPKGETPDKAGKRRETAAKVSALVIANALIFQEQLSATREQLSATYEPVLSLRALESEKDPLGAARNNWRRIWENIDYVPIFQLGERVLNELPTSRDTISTFRRLLREAISICSNQAALRHDLMGRIYHWLLHEAKHLGTFYTSVSAATLLLKLALSRDWGLDFGDPSALAEFKVADFACGTGTLLMAAAQAITDAYVRTRALSGRSLTPFDLRNLHRVLMEDTLYGYDVLPSAVHLTASTLGMLAPKVAFRQMNLFVLPLGVHDLVPHLGSLDFLFVNKIETQFALDGSHAAAKVTGAGVEYETAAKVPDLDLCVMNPPFVRSVGGNLLFGSLPDERGALQKELKKRTRKISASATAGLGAIFAVVADKHLKAGGRLAFVLPHAISSGEAWAETRQLIAKGYHLETVISSHDAARPNFSENTDLSEILFIARKLKAKEPAGETTYVSLWKNPTSIHEALDLAGRIEATESGIIQSISGSRGEIFRLPAAQGTENWHGALFSRGALAQAFLSLLKGRFELPGHRARKISLCPLSDIGELGYDQRDIHDAFTVSEDAWSLYPAFWDHKAEKVKSLRQESNAWLHARTEAAKRRPLKNAEQVWQKSADILLVERLWSITHRVLAVGFDKAVLGNTWWALKTALPPQQKKALLLWLNSTPGLLLFYGRRVVTRGPWVKMKKPAWTAMPVLDVRRLSAKPLAGLAAMFDEAAGQDLQALSQLTSDPVRKAMDDALSAALHLPDLAPWREMLGQEPGLTGKAIL
jgi:hypothetical protein